MVDCCGRTARRSGWSLKRRSLLQGAVVAEASHARALFAKVAMVVGLLMLEAFAVRRIVAMIAADLAKRVVAGVGSATEGFGGDVPMWSSSIEAAMLAECRAGWRWRRRIDESVGNMAWGQREHLPCDGLRGRLGGQLRGGLRRHIRGSSS